MKKFLIAALFVAMLAIIIELLRRQKAQWTGLAEAELRAKIDDKLSGRVPEEKRAEITDAIVTKMSERGMVADTEVVVDATATESEGSVATG